jgi:hypothetical protein
MGFFAGMSEFIVSLQSVRFDIDGLRLGMAAEVHPQGQGGSLFLLLLTQQKGNGGGAWGIALQGLTDGTLKGSSAVEVQQFERLSS